MSTDKCVEREVTCRWIRTIGPLRGTGPGGYQRVSVQPARRARTAAASLSSTGAVCAHERQASVIDTP